MRFFVGKFWNSERTNEGTSEAIKVRYRKLFGGNQEMVRKKNHTTTNIVDGNVKRKIFHLPHSSSLSDKYNFSKKTMHSSKGCL